MSRLPVLTPRELVAALKRAGFVEHRQRGSHLFLRHSATDLPMMVPIHARDLKRGTLKGILKQAGLTEAELLAYL